MIIIALENNVTKKHTEHTIKTKKTNFSNYTSQTLSTFLRISSFSVCSFKC